MSTASPSMKRKTIRQLAETLMLLVVELHPFALLNASPMCSSAFPMLLVRLRASHRRRNTRRCG